MGDLARPLVYVASSWRNPIQQPVVMRLRSEGFGVYDFRHPAPENDGFHWSEIDSDWRGWSPEQFREGLKHPVARDGFRRDYDALLSCDAGLLVLPSGRSSHLEIGYLAGMRKRTVALLANGEPELMYLLVDHVCVDMDETVEALRF